MTFVVSVDCGGGADVSARPWRFSLPCATGGRSAVAGSHALMAWGPKSGTQPPPAVLLALTYANSDVNDVVDRNGNGTPFDLS